MRDNFLQDWTISRPRLAAVGGHERSGGVSTSLAGPKARGRRFSDGATWLAQCIDTALLGLKGNIQVRLCLMDPRKS